MSNKIDFFKNLEPHSNCKDHTVSGEHFKVMINKEFEMLVTQPVPKNNTGTMIPPARRPPADPIFKVSDIAVHRAIEHHLRYTAMQFFT